MTAEEALPLVKALYMTLADTLSSEDIQPLGMAISALQKQIPVEPEKHANTYGSGFTYCCSACMKKSKGSLVWYGVNQWDNFCPHCGQKLLWEDMK